MAVYSLTGNGRSPLHAEPAQARTVRRYGPKEHIAAASKLGDQEKVAFAPRELDPN